jgi:hypothetical protein
LALFDLTLEHRGLARCRLAERCFHGQAGAIVTASFFVLEMEVQKPAGVPMRDAGLEAPELPIKIYGICMVPN